MRVGRIVFLRHGESVWNTDPVRFTGWANIDLTEKGKKQAASAGRCLKQYGILPDAVYTSLLKRSIDSLKEIANIDPNYYRLIPTLNSWRLNERHYGALVGLSKDEAEQKMGKEKVMEWRRSYSSRPPPMAKEDMYLWKNADWAKPITITSIPINNLRYIATEKYEQVPESESIQDTQQRVLMLWKQSIAPRIIKGETVLVIAHANSIRSMIKHIDNEYMTEENLREISIPSATPLVYDFMINNNNNTNSSNTNSNNSNSNNTNSNNSNSNNTNSNNTNSNKLQIIEGNDNNELTKAINIGKKQQLNNDDNSNNSNNNNSSSSIVSIGTPTSLGLTGRFLINSELVEQSIGKYQCALSWYKSIEKPYQDIIEYIEVGDGRNDAFIIYDNKGKILHSNNAWQSLCGFNNQEIRGKHYNIMIGPLTDKNELMVIRNRLESGLPVKTQMINYRKNGNAFVNRMTIIPVYNYFNKQIDNKKYEFNTTTIPCQYIAHIEMTPDLHDVDSLSDNDMKSRDLNSTWSLFR